MKNQQLLILHELNSSNVAISNFLIIYKSKSRKKKLRDREREIIFLARKYAKMKLKNKIEDEIPPSRFCEPFPGSLSFSQNQVLLSCSSLSFSPLPCPPTLSSPSHSLTIPNNLLLYTPLQGFPRGCPHPHVTSIKDFCYPVRKGSNGSSSKYWNFPTGSAVYLPPHQLSFLSLSLLTIFFSPKAKSKIIIIVLILYENYDSKVGDEMKMRIQNRRKR